MSESSSASPPQIPDYTPLHLIGTGGYGEVWKAQSLAGKIVAIKVIRRDRFSDAAPYDREFEAIQKYEQLARRHPALLDVKHVGKGEGMFYYVMPLADPVDRTTSLDAEAYQPQTLAAMLATRRRLPIADAVSYTKRLLEGVEALHKAKLIHRDIKPANVVFLYGEPVLADIGLVTTMDESHTIIGTFGYMPPENPGKPSADIYAMGKMLYVMASGLRCEDYPDVPTFTSAKDRLAYQRLNPVILRACDPNSTRRFQSAREMLKALAGISAAPAKSAAQRTPPRPTPRKAKPREAPIRTKDDFKTKVRDLIDAMVEKYRVGYAHDQQFLTSPELRSVTLAVRSFFRNHLGYLPEEVRRSCKLVDAVLEPEFAKRRIMLEDAFTDREEYDDDEEPSGWLSQAMQSLAGLGRLIEPAGTYVSTVFFATRFGLLQGNMDNATKEALDLLVDCVDTVIDDNWSEYRDEIVVPARRRAPARPRRVAPKRKVKK
ncbi:MAG: serine/threonine protein kinase [Planctomycetes bacterium]|nr:serine/threonine protein kinase [Planctomycetota bacterium]